MAIDEDDKAFFDEQMAHVRRLNAPERLIPSKPKNKPPQKRKPAKAKSKSGLTTTATPLKQGPIEQVSAMEALFFSRGGLQRKRENQLRQGRFPIEGTLDLHGMTIAEATSALEHFFNRAQQHRWRSLLIIHGKGGAKLKSLVNSWLRRQPKTLAFCSATPPDGGVGAVYVLLARPDIL